MDEVAVFFGGNALLPNSDPGVYTYKQNMSLDVLQHDSIPESYASDALLEQEELT